MKEILEKYCILRPYYKTSYKHETTQFILDLNKDKSKVILQDNHYPYHVFESSDKLEMFFKSLENE